MSRKSSKAFVLLFAAFLTAFAIPFTASTKIFAAPGEGIPGVNVGLKKKPGGLVAANFNIAKDGSLNLGQLEEGSYTLTFTRKQPPVGTCVTCKSYNDSKSNTAISAIVIEGVKGGSLSAVIDIDRNLMFNTRTFAIESLNEISFEVEGDKVVTGKVAFVQQVVPAVATPMPAQQ